MATSQDGGLVGQIGRLFDGGTVAGLPEGQILERYASHRDGAAFEALVVRHGSTVLGVCRRFLRDPNDVEDAFQATFVILARKASGLHARQALGPWLHGVAYRVASRARAEAARRRQRELLDEQALAHAPAPDRGRPDLRWLLDEEILRLPDKLRLPVVLCLMEGRTYDEAADQLSWTAGMVRGRLAEARSRLRDRLIRRGEEPSVAMGLVAIEAPTVPPALADQASRITSVVVSGKVIGSSAVALADRAIRGWFLGRIATAAMILVASGLAFGLGVTELGPQINPPRAVAIPVLQVSDSAKEKAAVRPAQAPTPKRRRGSIDQEIHPVTIQGRATDREGRPVPGASILVTNANRIYTGDLVLARGTAGADGRFVLRDVPLPVLAPEAGPIPRPAEAKFEVAGSAPGLAFTWHAIQAYRPTPKPADFKDDRPGLVAFTGEPIVADLVFGPPARVRGRIVDDQGRPVVGAKVMFGFVDSTRNPDAYGNWNCRAIDPNGGDDLSFNGVGSLPEAVRMARTDADGRYSLETLPREAKLLTLIDQDPSLEPYQPTIATSAKSFEGILSLGYDGVLDHTFIRPRTVPVLVTYADSAQPAPGVTVLAEVAKMQRLGAIGMTDPQGLATLALPPGTYKLRIEPPIGMPYRLAGGFINVREQAADSPLRFEIARAALIVLEAVDVDSGQGVAGVGFVSVTDTSADRREVQSQAGVVDHPMSDESGLLRVVAEPGRRQFFPGRLPIGYEAVTRSSPMLALNAGETTTARFQLKKKPETARTSQLEEDEVGHRLRLLWEAQATLIRRGRIRASRTFVNGDSIAPGRLRELLESLKPSRVPPLLDLIHTTFPDADPGSTGRLDITVDGFRHRESDVREDGSKRTIPELRVSNGRETVSFNPVNAQVDIGDDGPKSGVRFAVAGIDDFCFWPTWGGKVVGRADGRVTLEMKSGDYVSTIVAHETTGFVYRESGRWLSTGSGEDHWQFAPGVTRGGVIIPGLRVDFQYHKDSINALWIKKIESVAFDSPIPPETFLVAVPAGTQIRDYREGRDDTYRGVARWPITDVVAHADADPRRFKPFVRPIKVGQLAPKIDPLEWLDKNGTVPAPDLAGKVVLVDFWGIECGPCIAQLPFVREAAEHFTSDRLVILGLHDSSATPEKIAEFASKRGLFWTLAIDRPGDGFGATFDAYGVRSIPDAAVLDRQGKIAFLGDFRGALSKVATLLNEE